MPGKGNEIMDKLRQYLSLIRRRRIFVLGLGVVLLVAVACNVVAHTNLVWAAGQEEGRALAAGFGDAFIIAFVLALLVDPVAQHQFATEWGRDLYWAIFSPNAPPEFRDALQALAAPIAYISNCTYEIDSSDLSREADMRLQLYIRVKLSGVTLDRRGFRPSDKVTVPSGYEGARSRYRYWSFEGDDTDREEYNEGEMEALGAVSQDEGGRTVLDQSQLKPERTRIPFRGRYKAERHVEMTAARSDYFPFSQDRIVLKQVVIIRGTAVTDLDFTLIRLGSGPILGRQEKRPDGKVELRFENTEVAFPGQASILSWRPKTTVESTR
jgi:hypothetical protein